MLCVLVPRVKFLVSKIVMILQIWFNLNNSPIPSAFRLARRD
jgi:hypothetical protein